ncbi:MAG: SRPBCC family protein [Chloroflexota bacterium]
MQLTDEFTIPVAPDRAFELLLDLQNVAPCVPGGEIEPPDEEGVYQGRVTVRLGPMKFSYEGTLRIAEQDPASRTAVLEGIGKASGGAERARVRTVMEVLPEGSGSRVRMTTDLEIQGRAAQMGAGIIGAVSRRMDKQAAECLARQLTSVDEQANR